MPRRSSPWHVVVGLACAAAEHNSTTRLDSCRTWAVNGGCATEPYFMHRHCHVMCDTNDTRSHCAAWAQFGACTRRRRRMAQFCPEFCSRGEL